MVKKPHAAKFKVLSEHRNSVETMFNALKFHFSHIEDNQLKLHMVNIKGMDVSFFRQTYFIPELLA